MSKVEKGTVIKFSTLNVENENMFTFEHDAIFLGAQRNDDNSFSVLVAKIMPDPSDQKDALPYYERLQIL